MTRPRVQDDYLRDIVDAAQKAEKFVGTMDLDTFLADDKTSHAIARALEIVGEAAKKIPATIRKRCPDVP